MCANQVSTTYHKSPPIRRRPRQLPLALPSWGGRRKGAGRKSSTGQKGVTHRARPELDHRLPLHVTLRVAAHVFNLRSERSFKRITEALRCGADCFGVRIVQLSIQGNHIHCMVEAPHKAALSSAMKGLSVRLARRMNALMGRSGRVFADRYHARVLRTPTEVRHAIHYIRHNRRHHLGAAAAQLPADWLDPYGADAGALALPHPATWLLRIGWRRARLQRSTQASSGEPREPVSGEGPPAGFARRGEGLATAPLDQLSTSRAARR